MSDDTISRQVAIDALCKRCDLVAEDDEPCTEKCNDIRILEKLPPAQPKKRTEERMETHTCDFISRAAAISTAQTMYERCDIGDIIDYRDMMVAALDVLPSAQTEKHTDEHTETHACDCISRQAAIDGAVSLRLFDRDVKIVACDYIERLPSVQPEIIRCKDCKYWMRAYLSISGKHGCNVMRDYTAPDDYCFKAERKA